MAVATARMIRDEVVAVVPWIADMWDYRYRVREGLRRLENLHPVDGTWWLGKQGLTNYDWIILALEPESEKERFRMLFKQSSRISKIICGELES